MKKIISAVLILVMAVSALTVFASCNFVRKYKGKEIATIQYTSRDGYTNSSKTIDFVSGKMYADLEAEYDNYENRVLCTIDKESLEILKNEFYTAGLFDLEEEYQSALVDAGNYSIVITYADGSIKQTVGNDLPFEQFADANLAMYYLTGESLFEGIDNKYKEVPKLSVSYSNELRSNTIQVDAYEYTWGVSELSGQNLTEAAHIIRQSPDVIQRDTLKVTVGLNDETALNPTVSKDIYKYSYATVVSYDAEGGDRQVEKRAILNMDITLEIESGRIYVVEMDLAHGDSKYAFYYE